MVSFAGIVLAFALTSEASIFKMVENAYKITLAGAFVPLLSVHIGLGRQPKGRWWQLLAGLVLGC